MSIQYHKEERIVRYIIKTIIICILLVFSSTNTLASSNSKVLELSNLPNNQLYENPTFDQKKFETGGFTVFSTAKQLGITHYYQSDERWKDDYLGISTTLKVGPYGCAMTSFTMLRNYMKSGIYTPKQVNAALGWRASDCSGMCWKDAGTYYGLSLQYSRMLSRDDVIKNSKYAVNNNLPYIVGMSNGSLYHFVLASGFDATNASRIEDTIIYINDPLTRDYSTLQEYEANGWSLVQGVLYN